MSESKAHRDPSMDDILSSIRRIIQEDAGRAAAVAKAQPAAPPLHTNGPEAASPAAATAGAARPNGKPGRHDDVLLLTDLIEAPDPGGAPSPAVAAAPVASNPISSAMDRLARAVEEARPPVAPAASAGSRSLEDVVQEMLRPLLREWLEKNLPPLVERIVEREVQRLTQR